jgi:hypothetical protein
VKHFKARFAWVSQSRGGTAVRAAAPSPSGSQEVSAVKVLFWNVQGSGGDPKRQTTVNLTEDLAGLAERIPGLDLVILCEIYGQYGRHEYAKPAGW